MQVCASFQCEQTIIITLLPLISDFEFCFHFYIPLVHVPMVLPVATNDTNLIKTFLLTAITSIIKFFN